MIFGGIGAYTYLYVLQPEMNKYLPGGIYHIDTERERADERKKYLDELERFYALYSEYAKGGVPFADILPSEASIPDLFIGFEKIARDFNLGLEVIDFSVESPGIKDKDKKGKAQNKKGVQEVVITIKVSQLSYVKLKRLLEVFETSKPIFDITTLDFDPSGESASMILKTYYLPKT